MGNTLWGMCFEIQQTIWILQKYSTHKITDYTVHYKHCDNRTSLKFYFANKTFIVYEHETAHCQWINHELPSEVFPCIYKYIHKATNILLHSKHAYHSNIYKVAVEKDHWFLVVNILAFVFCKPLLSVSNIPVVMM